MNDKEVFKSANKISLIGGWIICITILINSTYNYFIGTMGLIRIILFLSGGIVLMLSSTLIYFKSKDSYKPRLIINICLYLTITMLSLTAKIVMCNYTILFMAIFCFYGDTKLMSKVIGETALIVIIKNVLVFIGKDPANNTTTQIMQFTMVYICFAIFIYVLTLFIGRYIAKSHVALIEVKEKQEKESLILNEILQVIEGVTEKSDILSNKFLGILNSTKSVSSAIS